MKTTIYCGAKEGVFHLWVEERINSGMRRYRGDAWFFPEVDYGCSGGPVARHPSRIIELVPEMVGKTIVTMSEHIVLAFQQLIRSGKVSVDDVTIYCGNARIQLDGDGDLEYWPGGFFNERIGLLG